MDAAICASCRACVRPCPTGAIDHWVTVSRPYTLAEQRAWHRLPAIEDDPAAALRAAQAGRAGAARAPDSASAPRTHLFTRAAPAVATVSASHVLTGEDATAEVRLIELDFGAVPFPFLEGQSLGVIPPGADGQGRPHAIRLYTIASARDGERQGTNTLALLVRRAAGGLASNWLCDLPIGGAVEAVGPFGETFLLPDDPAAELLMICTGTGRAAFRAFAHRRWRTARESGARLHLFFGAPSPQLFPAPSPDRIAPGFLGHRQQAHSRVPGGGPRHVQDSLREQAATLAQVLRSAALHVYLCGSRGLEEEVDAALTEIGLQHGVDWPTLRAALHRSGRFHVETY